MDATAGMSPSMETIAAGLAGFTLASLLPFARKPQAAKQESPPTSYMAVGTNLNSSVPTNTPAIHFPGMGHDFHMLARLVAEKQHPLTLPSTTGGAEESMLQILRNFHPQLTEFSSFEWRANFNGHKNYPNASEMVGRNTYITYAASSQSQPLHPTSTSSMGPGWMQGSETLSENIMAELEACRMRPMEEMPEESRDGQRGQRRRKCCGRDKDDEARRSHRGWCRSRNEDASPASRG
jgi:hypothetical protein